MNHLRHLLRDRKGATAVEYGLIVSMVVIAMVAALQSVANQTTSTWNNVNTRAAAAMPKN